MSFAASGRGERVGSAGAVLLCHAAVILLIATMQDYTSPPPAPAPLTVIDTISPPDPPAPAPPVQPPRASPAPAGGGSPPQAAATPLVVPEPVVPPVSAAPAPSPPVPQDGAGAVTGSASEGEGGVAGRGTGAGSGDGSGSGSGQGSGPPVRRARHVAGALSLADYPPALRRAGVGGRVQVHMDVAPSGRVSRCRVVGSSGSVELDALTCRLVETRYRFEAARDADGRAVADLVGESHLWTARRGR